MYNLSTWILNQCTSDIVLPSTAIGLHMEISVTRRVARFKFGITEIPVVPIDMILPGCESNAATVSLKKYDNDLINGRGERTGASRSPVISVAAHQTIVDIDNCSLSSLS